MIFMRPTLVVVCAFLGTLAVTGTAPGVGPVGPPPKEGRICNLDAKPFQFRLARRTGRAWSDDIRLAAGEVFTIRAGEAGDADALEGITFNGKGHVTIEYPELGGNIRIMLPAVDPSNSFYVPQWFHVKDSNGFSRLLQCADKDEAVALHKALLAEPRWTEAELARVKQVLRANYVLYDK